MEIKLTYENEGFDGHVIVKVATNIERFKIMDKVGLDIHDLTPSVDNDPKNSIEKKFTSMSTMIKILEISKDFYKEIDLKKGDKVYKSFDDLDNDSACQNIQMDAAMKCLLNMGDARKK